MTGLPAGITINPSTGLISGTYDANGNEPFTVTVTARTTGSTKSISKTFVLTIIDQCIPMSTLTIHNLDEALKDRLRMTAALHGRSMGEEVRTILRTVLTQVPATAGLGSRVHARFAALGGLDVALPAREEPPRSAVFEGSGTSARLCWTPTWRTSSCDPSPMHR